MTTEEQRDLLYKIASGEPDRRGRVPSADDRARAREELIRLPSITAETSQRPERHEGTHVSPADTATVQRSPPLAPIQEAERRLDRAITPDAFYKVAPTLEAAKQGLGRFVNGATGGMSDAAIDTGEQVMGYGGSRQSRDRFQSEHPIISAATSAAGAFTPGSVPGRIAGATERAMSSLSPKLANLLKPGAKGAGAAAARFATGTAQGGVVGAEQGAMNARGGPLETLLGAAEGGIEGLKAGAVLSAVTGLGRGAAGALHNEDIALLEKYGLEPSPVPGVPVVREGERAIGSVRNPPLTHKAGPASRAEAARSAARVIVPDLAARAQANARQLSLERSGNEASGVSGRPISLSAATDEVRPLSERPGALPEVRSALGTVEGRLREVAGPGGSTIPAGDLQEIASMSYDLGKPQALGMPKKQPLMVLGARLKALLPEEMRNQDARSHNAQSLLEIARKNLGIAKGDFSDPSGEIPPPMMDKATNKIRQAAEDTATSGNARDMIARLREEGPPEVMVGPRGEASDFAPDPVDYGSNIDLPRLHTAQERLQLNPSAVFSGAGDHGVTAKLASAGSRRVIYPVAKELGKLDVGGGVGATGDLVAIMRARAAEERRRRAQAEEAAALQELSQPRQIQEDAP